MLRPRGARHLSWEIQKCSFLRRELWSESFWEASMPVIVRSSILWLGELKWLDTALSFLVLMSDRWPYNLVRRAFLFSPTLYVNNVYIHTLTFVPNVIASWINSRQISAIYIITIVISNRILLCRFMILIAVLFKFSPATFTATCKYNYDNNHKSDDLFFQDTSFH